MQVLLHKRAEYSDYIAAFQLGSDKAEDQPCGSSVVERSPYHLGTLSVS
jgi:hypothetical protein